MGKKTIDFKFHKNWKTFMAWHDAYYDKAGCSPKWESQTEKIEEAFSKTASEIVDWKKLWKEFNSWYSDLFAKRKSESSMPVIKWSENKRQIETLMLHCIDELNNEQFTIVFLHKGQPAIDHTLMSYWDAVRVKEKLEGDSNGVGGDEDVDRITIINIKNLIKW